MTRHRDEVARRRASHVAACQGEPAGQARLGRFTTPHGEVRTPAFMPVGTRATVKGVWPEQVRQSGADILLGNTYHLHQRPGAELIAELGGLHRFMNWPGPILTDSGGYQVFSLSELNRVDDAGVVFRSHLDGSLVRLDPAISIRTQNLLGADIIMAFDQCPPADGPREVVAGAVERTIRWAGESLAAHACPDRQALFGIVQGSVHDDLAAGCADRLVAMDFPGYAVGGLAVGESFAQRSAALANIVPRLPADRPRYLMGVGMPRDILAAVRAGVDMFDCVLPTRNGRNACAFTATGLMKLRNEQYRRQEQPLEANCPCPTCRGFSRAYLRHLCQVGEMLGAMLLSVHNLWFYQRLMARIRDLIPSGDWATMLAEFPIAAGPGAEPAGDSGEPQHTPA